MTDHPMLYSAPMVRGLIREAQAPFTGKRQNIDQIARAA